MATELYRHVQRCGDKGDGDGSGIVTSGCMLLEGAITDSINLMDTELRRLITTQMRRDQRSKAATAGTVKGIGETLCHHI